MVPAWLVYLLECTKNWNCTSFVEIKFIYIFFKYCLKYFVQTKSKSSKLNHIHFFHKYCFMSECSSFPKLPAQKRFGRGVQICEQMCF